MRVHFAIPGDIETRTGGYIYDRRVMALLPQFGIDVVHMQLPASFPFPSADDLATTRVKFAGVPAGDVIVADGLAWGACSAEFAAATSAGIIALCHHPLGLESGLEAELAAHLLQNERAVLAASAHVIVTSGETAKTLVNDFGVPAQKMTVAEPGTDRKPRMVGGAGAPQLLAVGSVVPRKGYDVLVDALSRIGNLDWRCTIAGSISRAPDFAARVKDKITDAHLGERIVLTGEVDDAALEELYAAADIFVSASHYEGYGMVLTEALSRGLPIVTTTGGAAATTVPDGAAMKVASGDAIGLADALRKLIQDSSLRRQIAEAAWIEAENLPRWENTAAKIAAAIRQVAEVPGVES